MHNTTSKKLLLYLHSPCKDTRSLQTDISSITRAMCRQFGLKHTSFLQSLTYPKLDISVVQVTVPSECKGFLWNYAQCSPNRILSAVHFKGPQKKLYNDQKKQIKINKIKYPQLEHSEIIIEIMPVKFPSTHHHKRTKTASKNGKR